MPSDRCSFTPTDEPGELDEELELAAEELLHLLSEPLPDGDEGEDEVAAVGGGQVGEGGGEHVRPVPHRAGAPVDELQLLAEIEGEEAMEEETGMVA